MIRRDNRQHPPARMSGVVHMLHHLRRHPTVMKEPFGPLCELGHTAHRRGPDGGDGEKGHQAHQRVRAYWLHAPIREMENVVEEAVFLIPQTLVVERRADE